MTIRHLRIFITVAECGSMSGAAGKLYLSQPTVSQAIRELEEFCGTSLFDRLSKRLHITPAGQELLGQAYQIVSQFDQLEARMKNSRHRETLRVGGTITVGACLLSSIMSDFEKKMPETGTFTCVANTHTIEEKLLRSELDIAIVEGNIHDPDLVSLPCIWDSLVLGCSKEHPFASRDSIHASELNHQRFVMREPGSGTRALFDQFLKRHGLDICIAWEATCPEAFRSAILYNHCLAAISMRLMEPEIRRGQIHIFSTQTKEFERYFSLVYHKDKARSPAMDAIQDIINRYQQPDWLHQIPLGRLLE